METELQRLESSHSRPSMIKSSSSISVLRDDSDIKYTSLKDVLSALEYSPATRNASANAAFPGVHDFGASTISIRNQLVKHAASAYLQSAAIIATPEQSWLTTAWRQTRRRWVLNSRWQECARGPVGFYVRMIMRAIRRTVARAESRLL